MQNRLVRGGPFVVAPLRDGFRIATHVLGHSRLVCDDRVLEILARHDRPRQPAEVAAHFDESEKGVSFVLGHLVQAQLLVPEGFDSRRRIREAFAGPRAAPPRVAPSMPLAPVGVDRWASSNAAPPSELEQAAFALTPRSRLMLSPHVASLGVCPGETLALHPLGARVHLRDRLWKLARAFRTPTTVASVGEKLGIRSTEELLSACRFLFLERLLWSSRASERRALQGLAAELDLRPDGPSVRQWSRPHHQWTDTPDPCDWADVSRTTAHGTVAVIGQCQINFAGAALRRLARRYHVHLELFGEATPSAALAGTAWSAVFLTLADGTTELHEATTRGDWSGAQSQVPRVVAYLDELVTAVRRQTTAPVAVLSVSPPSLSPLPESAAAHHRRARLYAELNHRLAEALGDRDASLLDEARFIAAAGGDRVVLDDEYTGSAHHCAYDPRFWIGLTQWSAGGTNGKAAVATYPAGDPQTGASGVIAAGLFDFLRRRYERRPVRAVIFDPDTLLWPGHLRDKPAAHESLQRALGRPDYQFYCGANEALLAVRARGVKLVCVSALPSDTVREKWNVPAASTAMVSAEHLAGIACGASELEPLLAQLGVRADECLCVGLDGGPKLAGARVFHGDRWSIKRYLFTAPELSAALPAASSPTVAKVRATGSVPLAEIEAIVDAAIQRHLKLGPGDGRRGDDLRMLGLDSLTALELVRDIEARLDFQFEDRDLTVATIYRRSSLLDAAVRARGTRPRGEERAPGRPAPRATERTHARDTLAAQDRVADILLHHIEASRHPWQFKMVRSTRPNDYEYAGWTTLLGRAHGYAELFASLGARPGDVVTLMLPQGLALVSAFLGAVLHGFVPSIVAAPSVKLSESAFVAWFGEVAARSDTALVLCDPAHEEIVRACIAASPAPHIRVSSLTPAPTERAIAPGRRAPGPLLLQHSSGTTGLKKGVLLDERAVIAQVRHLALALRCDARDVVVSWAPLYHDMGLIACLLLPLLADLPVVMMSPFDWLKSPELLLREVTRERGTLSWMPNFAFMYSAQRIPDESLDGMDLSSWRAVVNCSEPVTQAATEAFHHRFAGVGLRRSALSASFAMAETTFAVTQVPPGRGLVCTPVDAERWQKSGVASPSAGSNAPSVVLTGSGEILEGTTVEIVDADGRVQEAGHAGEIRVRSDSLMDGYFCDTDATAAALRGGWYYTGDLGVVLGRELYVTGRKKDLVIVAGHNVYPHDVEESVGALAGVRPGRVVALGIRDEALGTERLVLLAETDDRLDETARTELGERVRAHVSSVFGVTAYDVRLFGEPTLLKSTSGKLSRSRNRDLYLERSAGT